MLPEHEWLPQAKRCAIGMRMRIKHRHERRENLTVANERGRYWAYCQACKDGAVLQKDHVLLQAPKNAHITPENSTVPDDLRPVLRSDYEVTVGRFLASKGMDFAYLPKLWYSERQRRLCLQDSTGGWHGRDLTGRSGAKWLHYAKPKLVGIARALGCTVVTEDIFSMYKVMYALRVPHWDSVIYGDIAVATTLGAGCGSAAALTLKNCRRIVWAYDGDKAGDDGFKQASTRMRAFGSKQYRARPPEGLDPKDMTCEQIREMIKGALNG